MFGELGAIREPRNAQDAKLDDSTTTTVFCITMSRWTNERFNTALKPGEPKLYAPISSLIAQSAVMPGKSSMPKRRAARR